MKTKNMTMKKIAAIAALALTLALVPVALAGQAGYSFTPIAFLDNPAPGGGNFTLDFEPSAINNRGEVGFTADVTTGGEGVLVGLRGQLTQIMRSGQPAPGGGVFGPNEFGRLGVNEGGDIAFARRVAGDECIDIGFSNVGESVYVKEAAPGIIQWIAHQGEPAAGGGVFRLAFGAVVNSRGVVVFIGDLPPPPATGA